MQNKEVIGSQENVQIKKQELVDVGVESRDNLPNEVQDWMEKVEENNTQSDIVRDIFNQGTNQIKTQNTNDLTKISISKKVFKDGFKKSVTEAGRWLSEFFLRLIKIKKGKIEFTDNDN